MFQNLPAGLVLDALSQTLDITPAQYHNAVKHYEAVGNHLARYDSPLARYQPEIIAQGSFMLGTMIRPLHENDDLDIDLVCQLTGKQADWTQADLKAMVGAQLRNHEHYRQMIQWPEGRRCWTLKYARDNYHMDILPCIVDIGYQLIMERSFSAAGNINTIDELAFRITDRELSNYHQETDHRRWLKSNPFGYASWFFQKAVIAQQRSFSVSAAVRPVPEYQPDKLPLQRIVQVLKRHRDIMFQGNEHKPISIIITTLAAHAYGKHTDLMQGLQYVSEHLTDFIKPKYSAPHQSVVWWVENPVNPEENFADKWVEHPEKKVNFDKWVAQLNYDLQQLIARPHHSKEPALLAPLFSTRTVQEAFTNLFQQYRR